MSELTPKVRYFYPSVVIETDTASIAIDLSRIDELIEKLIDLKPEINEDLKDETDRNYIYHIHHAKRTYKRSQ